MYFHAAGAEQIALREDSARTAGFVIGEGANAYLQEIKSVAGIGKWVAMGPAGEDVMPSRDEPLSELCYLDAARVTSPAGALSELDVVTASGEQLGTIAGVVIEAASRRARYLDVQSRGLRRRHYLVQTDQLAQVDAARKQLRLLTTEMPEPHDFRSENLRPYSDEDLLAAMFTSRVA